MLTWKIFKGYDKAIILPALHWPRLTKTAHLSAVYRGVKGHMRNFVIFVEGENFNLEVEGELQLVGFFATRRVEAETEDEASTIVLQSIKKEPELSICDNKALDIEPSMTVKNVHEMPFDHKNQYHGFTFFPMEE